MSASNDSTDLYPNLRRVVTGHDENGRSIVMIDAPCTFHGAGGTSWRVQDIWEHDVVPVPIDPIEADPTDGPLNFNIPTDGMRVRITDIPPTPPGSEPFMHRTNSVDYLHVLEGEITMLIEDNDHEITLRKGDTIVQRATDHAWVNRTDKHCRLFIVMVGGRITPALEKSIGAMPEWDPEHRREG
jgi:mannose-6-phosphate isomerase-like protein (cupin superfamily)